MKPEFDPNLILIIKNYSNLLSPLIMIGILLFLITLVIFILKFNRSEQNETITQDTVLLALIAAINALFTTSINYLLPKVIQPALALSEKLNLRLPLIMQLLHGKTIRGRTGHAYSSIPDFLLLASVIIAVMAIFSLIKSINNKNGNPSIKSSLLKNSVGINIFAFILLALTLWLTWSALSAIKPIINLIQ